MASAAPSTIDFQAALVTCQLSQEEEAVFFCKNCQEDMCYTCKTAHQRSKASCDHNIVSSTLSKTDNKQRKKIKCTTHPREVIQMYCINCDYIKISENTIDEIIKQRKNIKMEADEIHYLTDQVMKQKEKDLRLKDEEKKGIQNTISKKNDYLKSCEEKLNSMENISNIHPRLKILSKSKPPYIAKINPPTFINDSIVNLQDAFGKVVDLKTKPTEPTETGDGKIQKEKTKSEDRREWTPINNINTEVVSKIHPGVGTSLCISGVSDQEAWFGCGKSLVSVDINNHINSQIKLKYPPYDAVVISATELLVTFHKHKNILKLSPDEKHVKVYNIKPYDVRGMCLTSQGEVLVCLYNSADDNKVVMLITAGQTIHITQTIQKDKQQRPLFTGPWYVAENINRDICVVDDFNPTTIVVTNKEGEPRFRYPDHVVQPSYITGRCYGTACDNAGCILVSDHFNHRIHLLDIDGSLIKFVLTAQHHGIQQPHGLCIDKKGRLWLSNWDGYEVIVFWYRS